MPSSHGRLLEVLVLVFLTAAYVAWSIPPAPTEDADHRHKLQVDQVLAVDGVELGLPRAAVIARLGPPLRVEKFNFDLPVEVLHFGTTRVVLLDESGPPSLRGTVQLVSGQVLSAQGESILEQGDCLAQVRVSLQAVGAGGRRGLVFVDGNPFGTADYWKRLLTVEYTGDGRQVRSITLFTALCLTGT